MGSPAYTFARLFFVMLVVAILFVLGLELLDVPKNIGLARTAAGIALIGCGWSLCSFAYRKGGGNE